MAEPFPVLILLDSHERWRFFRRLARALSPFGYQAVFLTVHTSLYFLVRRETERVILAPCCTADPNAHIENACNVLSGNLKADHARQLYAGCRAALDKLGHRFRFMHALIWNGSDVAAKAVVDWAANSGISCGFLEIGNLPGKLFVDPKGVNAQSRLADQPELLDDFPDDVEKYNAWRKTYVQNKVKNGVIPQARCAKRINWWALLDRPLAGWVAPVYESEPFFSKAWRKLHSRHTVFDYDRVNWADGESFVFFPLQVKADSQILLNSDVGLEDALMHAVERAQNSGRQLVVRPHPAETDMEFVRHILQLKQQYRFLFSCDNIFQLMARAARVVTINSTAGLEAMILGTEVECLGRCFYKNFTQHRLRQYIMHFLVDIDYFNDTATIKEEEARTFLNRLGWDVHPCETEV